MGILKAIKGVGKKIFKGVKKVFKGVSNFVGKVIGSKWGKVLMTAAAVFTGGMAIAGGIGAFTGQAAGASFLTKFVAGTKGFMGALLNPIGAAKGAFAGAQGGGGLMGAAQGAAEGQGLFNVGMSGAAGAPAVDPTTVLEGGQVGAGGVGPPTPEGVLRGAPGGQMGAGGMGPPTPSAATAGLGQPAQQAGGGGLLSKAAGFAMSPGGGTLISNIMGGMAKGGEMEELMKEQWRRERFYDKAWEDPSRLAKLDAAAGRRVETPQGFLDRARRFDRETEVRERVPTVAYGG